MIGFNKVYSESECQACKTQKENKVTARSSIRPRIKVESAIKMAKKYAKEKGHSLDRYFVLSAEYDYQKEAWMMFFQGNFNAPGHHFGINIDDKTGKLDLFGGR